MNIIPPQNEGRLRAAASGVLPNGKPVVVNADGTVSVVDESTSYSVVTTKAEYSANNVNGQVSVYDTNSDRVVIVYRDSDTSNHGTAIVGTINAASITFGAAVVFENSHSNLFGITFDSTNNKIVISYRDEGDSGKGKAVVGTVDPSDNSISFGTPATFNSGSTFNTSAAFDTNTGKSVIVYRDGGNSNYGTAVTATISGTSISFGSETVYESADTRHSGIVYDSNAQKLLIVYRDDGNTGRGTALVASVSGTSISFGSAVVFYSVDNGIGPYDIRTVYDASAQKVVIFWDGIVAKKGLAIVGTISGTSVSFGDLAEADGNQTQLPDGRIFGGIEFMGSVTFDTTRNKSVFSYRSGADSFGYVNAGTVSGTSISFDSRVKIETGYYFSCAYSPDADRTSIAFRDADNDGATVVFPGTGPNLTAENYIGMSSGGQVASGSSATVDIIGTVNADQSSLTAGQSYFVQTDGTIGLTADSPSVFAGTAISSTKLLVKS